MAKKRTQKIPSRQDGPILGSQSECKIRFILPTRGFHHVININIALTANNLNYYALCVSCFST